MYNSLFNNNNDDCNEDQRSNDIRDDDDMIFDIKNAIIMHDINFFVWPKLPKGYTVLSKLM